MCLTYGEDVIRSDQQAAAEYKTWRTKRLEGHHLIRSGTNVDGGDQATTS